MSITLSDTLEAGGKFELAAASSIRGANQSVTTLSDRDAIPAYLRVPGVVCYVVETQLFYVLSNDLINWVEWTGGSVQPTKLIQSFDFTQSDWVIGTTGNVVIQEIVMKIIEPFDDTTEINVTANNIEVFSNNLVSPNQVETYTTSTVMIDASGEFQIHISNATQGRGQIKILFG